MFLNVFYFRVENHGPEANGYIQLCTYYLSLNQRHDQRTACPILKIKKFFSLRLHTVCKKRKNDEEEEEKNKKKSITTATTIANRKEEHEEQNNGKSRGKRVKRMNPLPHTVPQLFHCHNNNNNVHLSCAHQCPERSHDTY